MPWSWTTQCPCKDFHWSCNKLCRTLFFTSKFSLRSCIKNVLTLFYTPLKKTFNTFKRFYADPAKNFSQYSSRGLKQPSPVPNTLKGFSIDPWKISTPPKGSIQTLPPFHFVFPPFFFKLYLTQGFSTDLLNNFRIHLKGLGRTLIKIANWKGLLSN